MKCKVTARRIHYNGKFHYCGEKVSIDKCDLYRYVGLVEMPKEKPKKSDNKEKK